MPLTVGSQKFNQHVASIGQRPTSQGTESSNAKYLYQRYNSQSLGHIKPAPKSIKQQRDQAQLRFYQTLTN